MQSNQSARERLFGQQQQQLQQNLAAAAAEAEQQINKKIAMVKPELRETCEKYVHKINLIKTQLFEFDCESKGCINVKE